VREEESAKKSALDLPGLEIKHFASSPVSVISNGI
jgi:hypothetical protein